jgi:hypothetical protein
MKERKVLSTCLADRLLKVSKLAWQDPRPPALHGEQRQRSPGGTLLCGEREALKHSSLL